MRWARETYLRLRGFFARAFYPPEIESADLSSVHTILVLRYDRIGDMVQTTPLLGALREEFPNSKICVLASEDNAPVLQGNPHVDGVYVLPLRGRDAFFAQLNRLQIDLLIDPYLSYDWAWTRIATKIKARYRLCLDLYGRGIYYNIRVPAPLPPLSAADSTLEICRRGLKRSFLFREPQIYLQSGETESAREMLGRSGLNLNRPVVLLHPGGHYPEQRWPVERFAQVAVSLEESGDCSAALVGGPKDEPLLARTARFEPAVKLVKTDSLRQLIAALSCARLLICNNSGPLHLACALGLPTLSTLGPTDRVLWAPTGAEHEIIVRDPLDRIGTEEILSRARAVLKRL